MNVNPEGSKSGSIRGLAPALQGGIEVRRSCDEHESVGVGDGSVIHGEAAGDCNLDISFPRVW